MATVTSGPYPVHKIDFRIGTKGQASTPSDMAIIQDIDSFSLSIDGNTEEWTPMDTEGWTRRMVTGKGFTLALNGKRNIGDPGNDYIAALAWKTGPDCSSKFEVVFPDGSKLEFGCIVDTKNPGTGDSTNVAALECDIMSDGKPVYTAKKGG